MIQKSWTSIEGFWIKSNFGCDYTLVCTCHWELDKDCGWIEWHYMTLSKNCVLCIYKWSVVSSCWGNQSVSGLGFT